MARHPRGSYIVTPLLSLEVVTPENKLAHSSRHPCEKSTSPAVFSRIQLTLCATRRTPHGALRLVQATPAWSVKTRRAPSRHCRGARVSGHTTTAMNDIECTPTSHPCPRSQEAIFQRQPRTQHRWAEKAADHARGPRVHHGQARVPGGLGGAVSRRSKSRDLASSHGIVLRRARVKQDYGNPH